MRTPNGKLFYYPESKKAKLCRSENSPTGWVKVAGGKTGRDCHNPAKPSPTRQHKDIKVINVKKLNTNFTLKAHAKAYSNVVCPGASASAFAEAEVKQRFKLKSYLKMSGPGQAHTGIKLYDKAYAKAATSAHCDSTTINLTSPNNPFQPKNGVDGPGTNTPGQPGGPGAPGQPGSGNGEVCRDTTDPNTGDHNAATQGDIVPGPSDQFGNCY